MLVVIAIIGLLASIVVVGLGGSREKARDAKRISEVHSIQTLLETNYDAATGYPQDANGNCNLPNAPQTDPSGKDYLCEVTDGGQGYIVGACLETNAATSQIACPNDFVANCSTVPYCISQ